MFQSSVYTMNRKITGMVKIYQSMGRPYMTTEIYPFPLAWATTCILFFFQVTIWLAIAQGTLLTAMDLMNKLLHNSPASNAVQVFYHMKYSLQHFMQQFAQSKNSRISEASILSFELHEITFGIVIYEYGYVESVIAESYYFFMRNTSKIWLSTWTSMYNGDIRTLP